LIDWLIDWFRKLITVYLVLLLGMNHVA
jgi:hypothetical protein